MLERKDPSKHETLASFTDFDPDKVIEKVNNHKRAITPNFAKMSARPIEGPLPTYMQVRRKG
jgi:hypothetical protein